MSLFGVDSEFGKLSRVLLYKPGEEIADYPDAAEIQQLHPIDYPAICSEFAAIIDTCQTLGVDVELIDPTPLSDDRLYLYNMMFCRDLLFMTPAGAILACMANRSRAAEPLYAARALSRLGIPVLHTVAGDGRFEGADAIWLKQNLVLVGVGNRTNLQGYEQLAAVLGPQGVRCLAVPSQQTRTQHLLGTVQIVDRNLALVRHEIIDPLVIAALEAHGMTVVRVPENSEVRLRQAMNIVTVAPRTVIMTAGCPETRSLYASAGVTVAAELELTQVINGAGGLACATGILARER